MNFLKKNFKFIIPLFCLVVIAIIIVIVGFKKPKDIHVFTILTPLSVVSKVEDKDSIAINIFVNQEKSYYTDKSKINSCYLEDESGDNKIKLDITNITKINPYNEKISVKKEEYFNYVYEFKISFDIDSSYNLILDKAYLVLNFNNGSTSKINVGTFSYYKYENSESPIIVTHAKSIRLNGEKSGFYGIEIGIRNTSNKNILLKNYKILDETIKNIKNYYKETEPSNNLNIKDAFLNYPNIENIDNLNIELKKNDITYLVLPIISETNNDIDCGSFGIRFDYSVDDNTSSYYFNKFTFCNMNYSINENNIKIYNYEYK